MSTRSRLTSGVRQYLGNAADCAIADGGIPESTIYEVLIEVESGMIIDLDLSDQNRTVDSEIVTVSRETFNLASSNVSAASYVQVQVPNDDFWYPVEIVNHGSLPQARLDERMAVAFWGQDQEGEISWLPNGETYRLRVWYDKSPEEDSALADSPVIGSAYHSHLKLQAAAQCRELMGLPIGDVLLARLEKGERQWKKYVNMSRQQGTVQKKSWTPPWRRDYGRREAFRRP